VFAQVADENQIELRENMPQAVIDAPWHAMVLFDTFAGQECRQGKRTGARGGRAHEETGATQGSAITKELEARCGRRQDNSYEAIDGMDFGGMATFPTGI